MGVHGRINQQIDIYQNWPGFFAFAAWVDKVPGVTSPLAYAKWASAGSGTCSLAVAVPNLWSAPLAARQRWAAPLFIRQLTGWGRITFRRNSGNDPQPGQHGEVMRWTYAGTRGGVMRPEAACRRWFIAYTEKQPAERASHLTPAFIVLIIVYCTDLHARDIAVHSGDPAGGSCDSRSLQAPMAASGAGRRGDHLLYPALFVCE